MIPDKDLRYWDQRGENDRFLASRRWWWFHYQNGHLRSQRRRRQNALSREAEINTAALIRRLGYQAYLTTPNAPFDLWVSDDSGRACRVEVKISLFSWCSDPRKGGRFQANIHHHDVDLLVFIARNGRDWFYCIPIEDIRPRHNIAIWSPCPGEYTGQWQHYLDAWSYLDQAVANSRPRSWQLSMPLSSSLFGRGEGRERSHHGTL